MGIQGWTADQAVEDGKKFGLQLESQITWLTDTFYLDLMGGSILPYPLKQSDGASGDQPSGDPGSKTDQGDQG
jgi:hypothetical protein